MTQEQREELDRLIDTLKAGARLTASEQEQIVFYLEMLKDLARRLSGEWKRG